MTPEQLLQQIAEQQAINTQAITGINQSIGFLVTEFIRPNAQQALANYERIEGVESIVADSAQQISQISQALNTLIDQGEVNQQQIAQNTAAISTIADSLATIADSLATFDRRLEETRNLVANNASQIAQIGVKVDANAAQMTQLQETVESSRQETEALKEITHAQLAGIIGNAQRIDRLEQRAS